MQRTPVSSSVIRSIGYDAASTVLEIEFLSEAVYWYMGVPRSVYVELMAAGSKGSFFTRFIRNHYDYYQVY